jgi:GAF domain-containing protein/HAMP domain-containing protein
MTIDSRRQDLVSTRQRNAARITLITFALTSLVALATVFLVPAGDKTPIDNYTMPFIALSAGYSYLLARRGSHVRGILVLLAAIAIVSALYPLAANNVGWQTAVGMLLITTSIAYSALPEGTAGRISTAAFLFAIFVILIELFVTGIADIPLTNSSLVVTAILTAVYLGVILNRFRHFTLRTKLVIAFIFLSILSAGAVGFAISRLVLTQLTVRVEQQLTGVSNQVASSISAELQTQTNLLRALSLNSRLVESLASSGTSIGMDQLLRLDQQWRDADAAGNNADPLVRSVLENEIARELLGFRDEFPLHVEVFVTDINGANVAATNRTSDYYQADEEWWQAAYNNGRGAVFISQPLFDESSQILAVRMAIPVFRVDTGDIAGILATTMDLKALTREFEIGRLGQTGRTEIYLPDGQELEIESEAGGEFHLKMERAPEDFFAAIQADEMFMDTFHDGEAVLAAQSPIRLIVDSPEVSAAIQNLNWRVVTMQNRAEALQIVTDASRAAQVVGLGTLALAGFMAIGLAQFLTRPILRLTRAAEEVASGDLQAAAPVEAADEIGALAESFNHMTMQLRETLGELEMRVAERTADLESARLTSERRAQELHSISEISRIISGEQRQDILLPLIAQLVSEKFGFYHVGIFIVDDARQFAVLQAANSEGGRRMLERRHRLEVGQVGIVGSVAGTGMPRIALDVGADPVFFNNPDLPATRSEMALPLKLRGAIIGVLDVQSEKPGVFTEEDANNLSILADQIAIAIENARLFTQTQESLEEIQTLYRQNLREGWTAFSREETAAGYQHAPGGGRKLAQPLESDEIRQAMKRGKTLVFEAGGSANEPTLVVPIKLREQVIGVMNIKAPARDRQWTAGEIGLAEAISERLSLALENARLLEESQRRVIREQAISEIAGKIGASINLRNVLQTAVEELGRSLPGSEVVIRLQNGNPKADDR